MLLLSRKESYGAFAKVRMTVKSEDFQKNINSKMEIKPLDDQEEH